MVLKFVGLIVGEDPVNERELSPVTNKTDERGLQYTYQIFTHRFTWEDSGKKLRCVVVSEALGKDDDREVAEGINVFCELHSCKFFEIFNLQKKIQILIIRESFKDGGGLVVFCKLD